MTHRLLFACAFALTLTGCVERKMIIVSDPPGAEVYVDYDYAGTTPLVFPFAFYGTRDILVRHPGIESKSGEKKIYRSKLQKLWLRPPWWQMSPVDFFVEHFWPLTLTDEHRLDVTLAPLPARSQAKTDAALKRAESWRKTTEELQKTDPEGHTNPPPRDPNTPLEFDGEAK